MTSLRQKSSAVRRNASLLLLIVSFVIQQCIGGRHLMKTEFKHSPLGIGARSAFRDHQLSSWGRRLQKESSTAIACSNTKSSPDETQHMFASVYGNEAGSRALILAPRIKLKPEEIPSNQSEFEALKEPASIIHATRRTVATTNSKGTETSDTRGGMVAVRPLFFWENMISGAVSRSIAQTVMHPANTMKTIMQSSRGPDRPTIGQLFRPSMFKTLSRGAGANFVLSVPHGAVNFAVLELVRGRMNSFVDSVPWLAKRKDNMGPGLDFMSSAISTICCSVVSTPQMMITDNIMAGNYPALNSACVGLYKQKGILGFYQGWWPGLVGKIPSYALTWTFFQQLKEVRDVITERPAKNYENTIMGCVASAATVCIMIPLDTIKTRLVTQSSAIVSNGVPYQGIIDCAVRITREEGVKTFYRGLAPRLMSVVPMIGIQFGVYEAVKKILLQRDVEIQRKKNAEVEVYGSLEALREATMEVAASQDQPYPAPRFLRKLSERG